MRHHSPHRHAWSTLANASTCSLSHLRGLPMQVYVATRCAMRMYRTGMQISILIGTSFAFVCVSTMFTRSRPQLQFCIRVFRMLCSTLVTSSQLSRSSLSAVALASKNAFPCAYRYQYYWLVAPARWADAHSWKSAGANAYRTITRKVQPDSACYFLPLCSFRRTHAISDPQPGSRYRSTDLEAGCMKGTR